MPEKKFDGKDMDFIKKELDNLNNLARGCVPEKIKDVRLGKHWAYNDGVVTVAPMSSEEGYDSAKGVLNHELSHSLYTNMRSWNDEKRRGKDDKLFCEALNVVEDIHSESKMVERYAGADHFLNTSLEKGMEQHGDDWKGGGHEWKQRLLYTYAKARGYQALLNELPDYSDMDDLVDALKDIKSSGKETVSAARAIAERIREPEPPEGDDDSEADYTPSKQEMEESFDKLPETDVWQDIEKDVSEDVDESALEAMSDYNRTLYWFHASKIEEGYLAATGDGWRRNAEYDASAVSLTARSMFRKVGDLFQNEARVRKLKGYKSGRLHGGSLHKIRHDDFDVFTRKKRNAKSTDFAVSIMVDCSGSMSQDSGEKIQHAKAATYCISETLDRIGIKFNVVLFTSLQSRHTSRDEPMMITIKDFHEQWKGHEKYVGLISGMKENYDGYCLMEVYRKLMRVQARNHVIFVISDGQPAPEDNRVLENVMRQIENEVSVVGFGLNYSSINHFYKNAVCCTPEELPGATAAVLSKVLRLTELKKRA